MGLPGVKAEWSLRGNHDWLRLPLQICTLNSSEFWNPGPNCLLKMTVRGLGDTLELVAPSWTQSVPVPQQPNTCGLSGTMLLNYARQKPGIPTTDGSFGSDSTLELTCLAFHPLTWSQHTDEHSNCFLIDGSLCRHHRQGLPDAKTIISQGKKKNLSILLSYTKTKPHIHFLSL